MTKKIRELREQDVRKIQRTDSGRPVRKKNPTQRLDVSFPDTNTEVSKNRATNGTIQTGEKYHCLWQNDYHEIEVLGRRQCIALDDDPNSAYEYYIHYINLNKRLDKWVRGTELKPLTQKVHLKYTAPKITQGSSIKSTSLSLGTVTRRSMNKLASPSVSPCKPSTTELTKTTPTIRRYSRRDKRKFGELHYNSDQEVLEKGHEHRTRVKNIESIQIGKYIVDTWYFSPYPEEYRNLEMLYICEFCLKYMKYSVTLTRHKNECKLRHPEGNEIYRHGDMSIFEIDGVDHKIYCQCLCLLSKLFIDHKTLYYDVEPFVFYLLTQFDDEGHHLVGYFSKEKNSPEDHNLACILTFPQYQRKGYGKFLISLSYELSKLENRIGSPEKPLSDLGKISYRSYWTRVLLEILKKEENQDLTIRELSAMTCIKAEDIVSTLSFLGLVRYCKQQHIICVTPKIIDQHTKYQHPDIGPKLDVSKLKLHKTQSRKNNTHY